MKHRFAIRFVHLNSGWRWWAFEVNTGHDIEVGFRADGYESESAAKRAVRAAEKAAA